MNKSNINTGKPKTVGKKITTERETYTMRKNEPRFFNSAFKKGFYKKAAETGLNEEETNFLFQKAADAISNTFSAMNQQPSVLNRLSQGFQQGLGQPIDNFNFILNKVLPTATGGMLGYNIGKSFGNNDGQKRNLGILGALGGAAGFPLLLNQIGKNIGTPSR